METKININSLSYKDPSSKIYEVFDENNNLIKVLRGLRQDTRVNYTNLSCEQFYKKLIMSEMIINTKIYSEETLEKKTILADGWKEILEHELVDFISYPYEWSFSMLKDAALLHLFIIKKSFENSWKLKDASSYNVQWKDGKPIFIDIASFVPLNENFNWEGYRQFCAMFLIPLLIKKHLDINFNEILRSNLDGIFPEIGNRYFQLTNKFKKGVFSHIFLPTLLNNFFLKKNQKKTKISQNKKNILSLMNSIYELIKNLDYTKKKSLWLGYDKKNSYEEQDKQIKENFIKKNFSNKKLNVLWDIGCNNGHFSKLLREQFKKIIAFDYDHEVIEDLYLSEKKFQNTNIMPLVINFSNQSPNQGWNNELKRIEQRSKPDYILCLAFIHHARLVANIPLNQIINWLHSLNANMIIEFVDRKDEMASQLLENKNEKYEDYTKENFIKLLSQKFTIIDKQSLKNNKRELFFVTSNNVK